MHVLRITKTDNYLDWRKGMGNSVLGVKLQNYKLKATQSPVTSHSITITTRITLPKTQDTPKTDQNWIRTVIVIRVLYHCNIRKPQSSNMYDGPPSAVTSRKI